MNAGNGTHGSDARRGSHQAADTPPHDAVPAGCRYVVVALDDLRLALDIAAVERIVHAVEITPVAALRPPLRGSVDLHGEKVAVLDTRGRLGLPERELRLSDRLVLVRRGALRWFLLVDAVVGVVEIAAAAVRRRGAGATVDVERRVEECCAAEIALDEGTIAVLDVGRLLSAEQLQDVQRALAAGGVP